MYREVTNIQAAYAKLGIYGFQGSGKTLTAARIAIYLHKHIKSTKPVVFIDTEQGSDFVYPLFKKHGIKLLVDKTHAFSDLIEDMKRAEKESDILIPDSITHFWREMVRAYKARRNRTFISIKDWGPLKDEWAQFTQLYLNSKLHIIMCGRAGNIFEDIEAEDNEMKTIKVGTKMSAETETGYEPSLLIEMTKVMLKDGGKYLRRASVIKDRFNVIDSKDFDFSAEDPEDYAFKCFLPHIQLLNIGGNHVGIDTTRNSQERFPVNANDGFQRQRTILCEEIEGLLVHHYPGQTKEDKKKKGDLIYQAFQTRSWTKVEGMSVEALRHGLEVIKQALLEPEVPAADIPDKETPPPEADIATALVESVALEELFSTWKWAPTTKAAALGVAKRRILTADDFRAMGGGILPRLTEEDVVAFLALYSFSPAAIQILSWPGSAHDHVSTIIQELGKQLNQATESEIAQAIAACNPEAGSRSSEDAPEGLFNNAPPTADYPD